MANSAADAAGSELEIRRKLIEDRSVDIIVSIGSNFFYTVTLPCTLWFLDKAKRTGERANQVLFIDARNIYNQIDRAHRDFRPEQIEFLANIARLYRGEKPEVDEGSEKLMAASFPSEVYVDVPGLCKMATTEEMEAQGWSLNPGRYVGIAAGESEDFEFAQRLEKWNEELEKLNAEAAKLQERIGTTVRLLLEGGK